MTDYRVEKKEADVWIHFTNGEQIRGTIYLSLHSAFHSGGEDLEEYFRGREPFFPFKEASGQFSIIQKSNVAFVRYVKAEETEIVFKRGKVTLVFSDGSSVAGEISLDMPAGQERPLDYLNTRERFFVLYGEKDDFLINPATICRCVPMR